MKDIFNLGRPAIVAEIGINHNGDMKIARDLILSAKSAGCDVVKFQNYKTEQFIGQRSEFWEYYDGGELIKERQFDMFRRCELSFENLIEIDEYCQRADILWTSTPMCKDGLGDLMVFDIPFIKNGSDCLQDLDLIRAMAKTFKPIVISTGMAKHSDIALAVEAFKEVGGHLSLLHCCSAYPAPDEDINICRINTLRDAFGFPVGFSDHSGGITAAILSVAYGANMIEKHFTYSKKAKGPDHWFSSDPSEMAELVAGVHQAAKMIGSPHLGMTLTEENNRRAWFK